MRVHTPRHGTKKAPHLANIAHRGGPPALQCYQGVRDDSVTECWRRYRAGSPSRDASWVAARILSGRDAVQHTHGCFFSTNSQRLECPHQPLCLEGRPCISLRRGRPTTPGGACWRAMSGTGLVGAVGAASLSDADGLQNKNVAVPQRYDPTNLPCWSLESRQRRTAHRHGPTLWMSCHWPRYTFLAHSLPLTG
jgi:hypothetical protein